MTGSLFDNQQLGMQTRSGVFPGPYVERARLRTPGLGLRAPEAQFILSERELECLRLTGLQRNPAEALELSHRA